MHQRDEDRETIAELRAEIALWNDSYLSLAEARQREQQALRQVRDLHHVASHPGSDSPRRWCEACGRTWPCPTIALLDPSPAATTGEAPARTRLDEHNESALRAAVMGDRSRSIPNPNREDQS